MERATFRLPAPAVYSLCIAAFTVVALTRILAVFTLSPNSYRNVTTSSFEVCEMKFFYLVQIAFFGTIVLQRWPPLLLRPLLAEAATLPGRPSAVTAAAILLHARFLILAGAPQIAQLTSQVVPLLRPRQRLFTLWRGENPRDHKRVKNPAQIMVPSRNIQAVRIALFLSVCLQRRRPGFDSRPRHMFVSK